MLHQINLIKQQLVQEVLDILEINKMSQNKISIKEFTALLITKLNRETKKFLLVLILEQIVDCHLKTWQLTTPMPTTQNKLLILEECKEEPHTELNELRI